MKIKSSHITDIDHDPKTNTLKIQFLNGSEYHYQDFTAQQFEEFKNAESHGMHLATHIKPKHKSKKHK